MSYPALLTWCEEQAELFGPYIADTGEYLEQAVSEGKKVVLEAQLGAMRDIDYGIFPIPQVPLPFLPMVPLVPESLENPWIT